MQWWTISERNGQFLGKNGHFSRKKVELKNARNTTLETVFIPNNLNGVSSLEHRI